MRVEFFPEKNRLATEHKKHYRTFLAGGQLPQLRKILQPGVMLRMLSHLPGMGAMGQTLDDGAAHAEMARMLGIIDSTTPHERRSATLVDQGRRNRIARGAGVETQEVVQLLKQFEMMAPVMKSTTDKSFFECRLSRRR